ncbi:hypothetical protein BS17DRAFT_814388 [Gyrodon lividus]|nr:hypothetical protein BS17DRAFT_814388 [Gyrodon lividus]
MTYHKDDNNELFDKSTEWWQQIKAQKEVECRRAEEEARQKAEKEVRQSVEVEAQRKAEAEARVHMEEVVQLQSLVMGPSKGVYEWSRARRHQCKQPKGLQTTWRRKWEEVASLWASKKKAQMWSLEADKEEEEEEDKDKEWAEGEDNRDVLGTLMEVLVAVVAEYEEEEVAEVATEREEWKAQSGEEDEVERKV